MVETLQSILLTAAAISRMRLQKTRICEISIVADDFVGLVEKTEFCEGDDEIRDRNDNQAHGSETDLVDGVGEKVVCVRHKRSHCGDSLLRSRALQEIVLSNGGSGEVREEENNDDT